MLSNFSDARVLVITDDLACAELLGLMLSYAGLRDVVAAADGRAALELASEIHPDAILLDLEASSINPFAAIEQLAAPKADGSYVPMLVLTGETSSYAVRRALSLGARDYLTKPLDPTDVVVRMHNLLEASYLFAEVERGEDRNGVAPSAPSGQLGSRLHDERVDRIERVLERGTSMSMVFQPIIDLTDRAVVGVEALSRFASEPLRSPDLWFAEAAWVGLGPRLEMRAVSAAIGQVGRLPEGAFLALKVSPELVVSGKLNYLLDDPACSRFVLELTEHEVIDDYGPINRGLEPLREQGIRVAVDDTGAGFASMRHILLLKPEIIKLDRSLTHGVDHDPARRALASSLVSFAKDIDAHLIAEGVETAAELVTLGRLGAQWVQGFHIARPEPLPV